MTRRKSCLFMWSSGKREVIDVPTPLPPYYEMVVAHVPDGWLINPQPPNLDYRRVRFERTTLPTRIVYIEHRMGAADTP